MVNGKVKKGLTGAPVGTFSSFLLGIILVDQTEEAECR